MRGVLWDDRAVEGWLERLYRRVGRRYLWLWRIGVGAGALLSVPLAVATFGQYEDTTRGEFWQLTGLCAVFLLAGYVWLDRHVQASGMRELQAWLDAGRPAEGAHRARKLASTVGLRALPGSYLRMSLATAVPAATIAQLYFDLGFWTCVILYVAVLAGALLPSALFTLLWDLYIRPVVRDAAQRSPEPVEIDRPSPGLRLRLLVALPIINGGTGVLVAISAGWGEQSFAELGRSVLAAVTIGGSVSLLLVVLVIETFMGPLRDLVDATRRVGEGDLAIRVPPTSEDELGMLMTSFNGMTEDLQRARERLVTAREEERRRLRRDLHDGLGPTLVALALQADLAERLTGTDEAAAREVLADLARRARDAAGEARRIAHGLRPPVLAELGLVEALRDCAEGIAPVMGSGLQVDLEAPEHLPALPAAVEVAAYRIAQEALANVVRHAGARRCRVRLEVDGHLELEVADDGRGLRRHGAALADHDGVGLASMRERAAELGGICAVESTSRGTIVRARLPVVEPAAA